MCAAEGKSADCAAPVPAETALSGAPSDKSSSEDEDEDGDEDEDFITAEEMASRLKGVPAAAPKASANAAKPALADNRTADGKHAAADASPTAAVKISKQQNPVSHHPPKHSPTAVSAPKVDERNSQKSSSDSAKPSAGPRLAPASAQTSAQAYSQSSGKKARAGTVGTSLNAQVQPRSGAEAVIKPSSNSTAIAPVLKAPSLEGENSRGVVADPPLAPVLSISQAELNPGGLKVAKMPRSSSGAGRTAAAAAAAQGPAASRIVSARGQTGLAAAGVRPHPSAENERLSQATPPRSFAGLGPQNSLKGSADEAANSALLHHDEAQSSFNLGLGALTSLKDFDTSLFQEHQIDIASLVGDISARDGARDGLDTKRWSSQNDDSASISLIDIREHEFSSSLSNSLRFDLEGRDLGIGANVGKLSAAPQSSTSESTSALAGSSGGLFHGSGLDMEVNPMLPFVGFPQEFLSINPDNPSSETSLPKYSSYSSGLYGSFTDLAGLSTEQERLPGGPTLIGTAFVDYNEDFLKSVFSASGPNLSFITSDPIGNDAAPEQHVNFANSIRSSPSQSVTGSLSYASALKFSASPTPSNFVHSLVGNDSTSSSSHIGSGNNTSVQSPVPGFQRGYKSKACTYYQSPKGCARGDKCTFAHMNSGEQFSSSQVPYQSKISYSSNSNKR